MNLKSGLDHRREAVLLTDPERGTRLLLSIGVALLLLASFAGSEFHPATLINSRSLQTAGEFFAAFWPPRTDAEFLQRLMHATVVTVSIATVATVTAIILAAPLVVMVTSRLSISSRGRPMRPLVRMFRGTLRGLLLFLRSVPELIWALLFVGITGLGATAGIMGLLITNDGDNATLSAQIKSREADLARATSQADQYRGDLSRRVSLANSGAISSEELKHTQAQLDVAESSTEAARAAVAAAREQLTTSLLLTANTTPAEHPRVKRAAAEMRNAMLALERTEIRAPVDGYVAQRRVQLGQRVQPGSTLMSVIPLQDVWVDANFKESQLADMRIGQRVELVADIYRDEVVYQGTVQGLGAGTGAAFALLPAQNATGNWIKVVQRVPVRIRLDGNELEEHPLRIGLSLSATVHTDNTDGERLSGVKSTQASEMLTSPAKVAAAGEKADAVIQQIIDQNIAEPPATAADSAATARN